MLPSYYENQHPNPLGRNAVGSTQAYIAFPCVRHIRQLVKYFSPLNIVTCITSQHVPSPALIRKTKTSNKTKENMKGSKITAYQINLINSDSSGQISKITFHNFLLLPAVSLEPLVLPLHYPPHPLPTSLSLVKIQHTVWHTRLTTSLSIMYYARHLIRPPTVGNIW